MIEINNNQTIQERLSRLVVEEIMGHSFDKANIKIGQLEANHFSFIFSIEILNDKSNQKVFVKIPKEDLRRGKKEILPITAADCKMANDEAYSLRTLGTEWQADDLNIHWVRMRGEYNKYNAIVTDAVQGVDAFGVFRRLDLCRRLGLRKDRIRLREAMSRIGTALGRFHKRNAKKIVFHVDEALPKLEQYYRELGSRTRGQLPDGIAHGLSAIAGLELEAIEVSTLKGIDIRNIIMDGHDSIFMLDPGRMKRACREADLARFIMTYRILYWGSWFFLLGIQPDKQAEKAFLDAYYSNNGPPSRRLLNLFLIKEQLKHWHTAIDSLNMFSWPTVIKNIVEATYINPYYIGQLAKELKKVI